MKNALLAVLFIAFCYEITQAQVIPQRPAGYIKKPGTHPTQPVGKGSSTNNTITDGVVTAGKLANDIFISNITTDGTVTTDKLADDILNAMKAGNRHINGNNASAKICYLRWFHCIVPVLITGNRMRGICTR